MTHDSLPSAQRRSFFTRLNTGLASMAAMAGAAMAQEKPAAVPRWQPARHDADDWLDKNQAKHRVVFDTILSEGLGEAVAFTSNFYRANKTDYALESSDLAVVIILRHKTAAFGYNDAIWAKYGEPLNTRVKLDDPKTKQAPKVNLFNAAGYGEELPNHGTTLDSLVKLGVQFAVCKLSTRALASTIAKATGGKADEVFAEIGANLIPSSRLVAAGIVAVNRAQERGYTLMSI
jgi:intracellular sulfur oxidation DsrE/DsrF family protein